MKLRNGFVSNSSSSSFIVTLPKSIDDYTLEEFRELIGEVSVFDPVKQLYNDLKNKDSSQPTTLTKWEKEYFEIDELTNCQYIVSYGNECDETYGHGSDMEYEFMPYISNDEVSVRIVNGH